MATQGDVRRIALALPETEETDGRFAFSVRNKGKLKGFVWVWMERVNPKKPRVANPAVVAIRVPNLGQRDALLSADPTKFFTEPHYAGFPAVLCLQTAFRTRGFFRSARKSPHRAPFRLQSSPARFTHGREQHGAPALQLGARSPARRRTLGSHTGA